MRVQIENNDGTWTELAIENGIALEVETDPVIGRDDGYWYHAKFDVSISQRQWHNLLWDLSEREVRGRDARASNSRFTKW
jgi:hypothetical protein